MASSRRSAAGADPDGEGAVLAAIRDAFPDGGPDRPVVVAFSGGLDSTVLLEAAVRVLGAERCIAAHVHHGLQPAADDWPSHCAREATRLGARFECVRLAGAPASAESIEAWAREHRYEALASLSESVGAGHLLTAHHLDDQAETLMLRIARGSGVDGLAGIRRSMNLGGVRLMRPLLHLGRSTLTHCARAWGSRWIEDPSNLDTAFRRNALRHRVMPVLDEVVPTFRANLTRLSGHLESARRAVSALAEIDLRQARQAAACRREALRERVDALAGLPVDPLDVSILAALPDFRRHAALRAWIAAMGAPAPSERRLVEIDRQLLRSRPGRGAIRHGDMTLRSECGWLFAEPETAEAVSCARIELRWRGERALEVPTHGGRLCFEPVQGTEPPDCARRGVSEEWLRGITLSVEPSVSGARLRVAPGGRARTLKNLLQEAGVPPSLRRRLPTVRVGDRLLYAGGIGMDQGPDWPRDGNQVRLRWLVGAVRDFPVV